MSASRLRAIVRLLRLLALAVLTVIASLGMTSPGWTLATALASPSSVTAGAARFAPARAASDDAQHGVVRAIVEPNSEESDLDDEDSPLFEFDARLAFSCAVPPRRSDITSRGEPPIDTSRFASGAVLPRGPPV
jgi:hypothetical protein